MSVVVVDNSGNVDGIADPQGFAGEFRDKPGVFLVPAGAEKTVEMSVTLL